MFEIVDRQDFSDVTYLLEVAHPLMAEAARPGQFVIVLSHEQGERVPLTIADFDARQGHDHAGHPGGRQDHAGDAADCVKARHLFAVVGPMGLPSALQRRAQGRCASAAGWASLRSSRSFAVTSSWGPTHRRHRVPQQGPRVLGGQVRRNCDELIICTDDGSYGPEGPRDRRR